MSKIIENNPYAADTMKMTVKDVFVSGNEITKDEIILREMSLKKGSKFTVENYAHDLKKIYNLRLFTKVDIAPVPVSEKQVLLNVHVEERWYILPLPQAGIEDGEWAKKWFGVNIRWDNFRGRNETVSANFRFLYNPFIKLTYSVPWIGKKLHLYTSIGGGYMKIRNQSLAAVGRTNGGEVITASDTNFDNTEYYGQLTVGKYISGRISVFTDIAYNYLKVSQYAPGRTLSPTGTDKYMTLGAGVSYDSRDIIEFATKGFYLKTNYLRYGFLQKETDFGRWNFEAQSFIPINFTKHYYITIASRVFTTLANGAVIPYYQHVYLGYSGDYVRGWKKTAFEGEDEFTLYNEIRIPLIQPTYVKAEKVPVIKGLPIVGKMSLKYGLYLTPLYDIGTVWDKGQSISKVRFFNGAGIGLNAVLPFGYIVRVEWEFRLGKPTVGAVRFSLYSKF